MLNRFINQSRNFNIVLWMLHRMNRSDTLKEMLVKLRHFPVFKVKTVETKTVFLTAITFVGVKKSAEISIADDSVTELLRKSDQLLERDRFEEALHVLNSIQNQSISDVKWRQGRILFKIYECDKRNRQELIPKAYELVREALKLNDKDIGAHQWMAILIDAKSELDGLRARIGNLPQVKEHMHNVVKINPGDAMGWYFLGRFSYGIANLSWYERKLLQSIYPSITSTNEEALDKFLRAEEINPNVCSLNKLYIGKCYEAIGEEKKAEFYLTLASNVTVLNKDDEMCKEKALKLLKKYKKQ